MQSAIALCCSNGVQNGASGGQFASEIHGQLLATWEVQRLLEALGKFAKLSTVKQSLGALIGVPVVLQFGHRL